MAVSLLFSPYQKQVLIECFLFRGDNCPMPVKRSRKKRGYLIYLCILFFMASLASVFLPFFGQILDTGEIVYFDSFKMIFGGQHSAIVNGTVYNYSFSLNLPYALILVFNTSGILFALSARNSPSRIMGTTIIAFFSLAFFAFSRFVLMASNASLVGSNFALGIGFYIALISNFACAFIAILEFCLCLHYRHKREAFR
ncbi:MAG: hypothetical protein II721_01805 [Bacilli bacterium]|nr:hypothetical protein [Bacilli bacterium]